jgi:hypothetical protein
MALTKYFDGISLILCIAVYLIRGQGLEMTVILADGKKGLISLKDALYTFPVYSSLLI